MKKTKICSLIACGLLFVGCIIFGITAINQNFVFDKMFYAYNYETKTRTIDLVELSTIESIDINLKNVNVSVYVSDDSRFKLTYNEYENREYQFATNDNILKITISDINWFEYLTFQLALENNAKLYIPTEYNGEIRINNDSKNVSILDNSLKDKVILI